MRLLPVLLALAGWAWAQAGEPADPETCSRDLGAARIDLRTARWEFKRLPRLERVALEDARTVVFSGTARGRAMAPAYGAAGDLLAAAAAQEKDRRIARLCSDMAASVRSMARALDKQEQHLPPALRRQKPTERAAETYERARRLLETAAQEKDDKNTAAAWRLVKQGDPRYRALARGMRALKTSFATAGTLEATGKTRTCLTGAKQLIDRLQAHFDGVATERPRPAPAPT
ncbi:MAG: hypothetical protein ACYTEZ_04705 [Planctomycetota bacterium]|jgi:hypothetical protein